MANLYVTITEAITLDGTNRGVTTIQTISNINGIDNRILTCPTGSYTGLFYFNSSSADAAVFTTGSFKYGRIANKSNIPVKLLITTSGSSNETFLLTPYSSFMLSSASASGSIVSQSNFTFNDYISKISVEPSGASATIEYFIATT
jgi:hypothetical protein